jgi:hypothetical protein
LNGDPTLDLAVANSGSNTVSVLLNYMPVAGVPSSEAASEESVLRISPNPASGPIRVQFSAPPHRWVSVGVYDVAGRLVRTVLDQALTSGLQSLTWDTRNGYGLPVSAGVYCLELRADAERLQRRIVIVR